MEHKNKAFASPSITTASEILIFFNIKQQPSKRSKQATGNL
jgi:hypothetical protein